MFDDLWIYVEMMLEYNILTYHDEAEEYVIEGNMVWKRDVTYIGSII